jgi:hypothetical protein
MPHMQKIPALIELLSHALSVPDIVERSQYQAELIQQGLPEGTGEVPPT